MKNYAMLAPKNGMKTVCLDYCIIYKVQLKGADKFWARITHTKNNLKICPN
jgi:hypothetical protein